MRRLALFWCVLGLVLLPSAPAMAHDTPEGSEWVMADWMFLSFAAFGGVAFVVFIVAFKRGLLSNLEDAKYPMLSIDEPDYYTPDWAKIEHKEVRDG